MILCRIRKFSYPENIMAALFVQGSTRPALNEGGAGGGGAELESSETQPV